MDWKKLALCGAMTVGSFSLVACGGTTDGGMDPVTRTYVVSTISIPEATTDGRAAGFNLDGMVTDGSGTDCVGASPDYISTNDMEPGTDNGLATLVPTLAMLLGGGSLDATIQEQITEGSLILLMEVSDINSYNNDTSVSVQLFLGEVPGGGAPMTSGSGLAPGQTFTSTMALGSPVTGAIESGRLRVTTPLLMLNIATDDFTVGLPIRMAQVRANITETGLTNGAIGGGLNVEDLAVAAEMIMAGLGDTVRSVLGGVADLNPTADPMVCDSLSVGILFTGVEATRNAM